MGARGMGNLGGGGGRGAGLSPTVRIGTWPKATGRARTAPTGRAHVYMHPPRGAGAALSSGKDACPSGAAMSGAHLLRTAPCRAFRSGRKADGCSRCLKRAAGAITLGVVLWRADFYLRGALAPAAASIQMTSKDTIHARLAVSLGQGAQRVRTLRVCHAGRAGRVRTCCAPPPLSSRSAPPSCP